MLNAQGPNFSARKPGNDYQRHLGQRETPPRPDHKGAAPPRNPRVGYSLFFKEPRTPGVLRRMLPPTRTGNCSFSCLSHRQAIPSHSSSLLSPLSSPLFFHLVSSSFLPSLSPLALPPLTSRPLPSFLSPPLLPITDLVADDPPRLVTSSPSPLGLLAACFWLPLPLRQDSGLTFGILSSSRVTLSYEDSTVAKHLHLGCLYSSSGLLGFSRLPRLVARPRSPSLSAASRLQLHRLAPSIHSRQDADRN